MKTIGLLGGMSWKSTITYYQEINQLVNEQLGAQHSAKVIINSVDFDEIVRLQHDDCWDALAQILIDAAKSLELAGAELLVICSNTMHKIAPQMNKNCDKPIVHIADATAEAITKAGIKKVGLLGTKFTMEQDFYKGMLEDCHGLSVIIPDENDREIVHSIIYHELCCGKIADSSRSKYQRIIDGLVNKGAEGIILGCTEINLLVQQEDIDVPVFDTTLIHSAKAVEIALE